MNASFQRREVAGHAIQSFLDVPDPIRCDRLLDGCVHVDRDHAWHMDTLAKACRADPDILLATPYRVVDVTDPASQESAVTWWEELTALGGEGMVVKPFDFIARDRRGLVQPALKTRCREYLRIIYGPEYDLQYPHPLIRLQP